MEAIPLSLATYDCRRVFQLGRVPRPPRTARASLISSSTISSATLPERGAVLAAQQTLTLHPLCASTREPR